MQPQQRYISNELIHFLGRKDNTEDERYDRLCNILREGRLRGEVKGVQPAPGAVETDMTVVAFNLKAKLSENQMFNPNMVCFCDIPVQELGIHIKKYKGFGIGFDKDLVARRAGVPVYYIPKKGSMKHKPSNYKGEYFDEVVPELCSYLGDLIDKELDVPEVPVVTRMKFESFLFHHVFSYLKFFDHKLPEDHEKNYYFEREWRVLGTFKFGMQDIRRILLPENFAERFRKDFSEYYGQLTFTRIQ